MKWVIADFLAGALTAGFLVAGMLFLRFWHRTHDRLFLAFAVAFVLMALNQAIAALLGAGDERTPYSYALRVLGFLLILYAIVDKTLFSRPPPVER